MTRRANPSVEQAGRVVVRHSIWVSCDVNFSLAHRQPCRRIESKVTGREIRVVRHPVSRPKDRSFHGLTERIAKCVTLRNRKGASRPTIVQRRAQPQHHQVERLLALMSKTSQQSRESFHCIAPGGNSDVNGTSECGRAANHRAQPQGRAASSRRLARCCDAGAAQPLEMGP